MAVSHLKHKHTGELRELETGSQEYLDLAAERLDSPWEHRTAWEDRGVAAHAEKDVEPANNNINDRDYNHPDTFPGVEREEEQSEHDDDVILRGNDREQHATVHAEHLSKHGLINADGSVKKDGETSAAKSQAKGDSADGDSAESDTSNAAARKKSADDAEAKIKAAQTK